jgi:hypothetical protein
MKRVEIVANRSVEADLMDALANKKVAGHYTKIPEVHGVGSSGPRMGDHIWPEENFMLVVYCEEAEARKIREAVDEVKEFFADEGIKIFEIG